MGGGGGGGGGVAKTRQFFIYCELTIRSVSVRQEPIR